MKILFLAPQPFYQERGTPIAVKMLLEILSQRGDEVDVVTYHEGEDVQLSGVRLHRTPKLKFVRNIRPGFSIKKLFCDVFVLWKALRLASRNRYHIVHAVEESAFIALILKLMFRVPYIYDMDSSIAQQMVEKYPKLGALSAALDRAEGVALRHADVVIPVCDQLDESAKKHHPKKTVVLYDVPLLNRAEDAAVDDVRAHLPEGSCALMYVGNLEVYQGIDLLVESFALAKRQAPNLELVIIGGQPADIEKYQRKSRDLGVTVHFLGAKPVAYLARYLAQADVLVSPRIKGSNTPMKIYSYLDSGKPILATDLRTHTQVLDQTVALLTAPNPAAYAEGMVKLAADAALRQKLGEAGKAVIAAKYSYERFFATFTALMDDIAPNTSWQPGSSRQEAVKF